MARWRTATALVAAVYLGTLAVNRSLVEVRGGSMEPTLWPGDRLLTVPARRAWLRTGRVVVVAEPGRPDHLVVKRLTRTSADGLAPGRVEVLGDHAAASTDSRAWGPVPVDAVRRVVVRRWPDLRTRLHR
ncbi:nickel-type superoxide dismutase maturation protease [Nitriliruptoraceae bacterium ZYF776]|nr:nickel-type superoxide dismutase maturation protease [Profundirhabdus halotolerans]